jgi:glycosyltransferase involved in cell wall biosynthesis
MLNGESIIYFGPERWEGLWRNRHQLMTIFARNNQVLYVERRKYLRTMLTGLRSGSWFSELRRPPLRQVGDGLFVYRYPPWSPISGQFPLNRLTAAARRLSLRHALAQLNMVRPIVWFSHPSMLDLIDEVPALSLRLYHVVDEYTAYSGQSAETRRSLEDMEKRMMAQVDGVVVVSKKLEQAKRLYNPNTYLVPNGVDYALYSRALANPCLPERLQAIRPPRVGYSGLIGDKLDLEMLRSLALENPEWSLVLLGEARVVEQVEVWQALRALPNVHYLGMIDPAEVPDYLKGFDVGLMPYHQNRHAEHINPLKLYDYLAAGIAVAALDIPAARDFTPYLHIARGPQQFVEAVRLALADRHPERDRQRRAIAAQHTWEARAEQISQIIKACRAASEAVSRSK